MGDQLIAQVRDALEGPIDFAGQKRTEQISTGVLIASGFVALLVGFIQQNIHYTLWLGLAGTAVAFFMVVPPWPLYNEDPESWLNSSTRGANITVDGKKVN